MLISKPSPLLKAGAGVTANAIATTSTAGLFDGRSGAQCELSWPAGNTLSLDVSWPATLAMSPRVLSVVNIEGYLGETLTANTWLKQVGGAYDYTAQSAITRLHLTGERSFIGTYADGLELCEGARIELVDTSGAMTEGDRISIGEIVVSDAWGFELDGRASDGWVDTAGPNSSKNGQLYLQPVPAAREFDLTTIMAEIATVYGANALAECLASLATDPRAVVIIDESSQDTIWRAWLYGRATQIGAKAFDGSAKGNAKVRFTEMVGLATV